MGRILSISSIEQNHLKSECSINSRLPSGGSQISSPWESPACGACSHHRIPTSHSGSCLDHVEIVGCWVIEVYKPFKIRMYPKNRCARWFLGKSSLKRFSHGEKFVVRNSSTGRKWKKNTCVSTNFKQTWSVRMIFNHVIYKSFEEKDGFKKKLTDVDLMFSELEKSSSAWGCEPWRKWRWGWFSSITYTVDPYVKKPY